MSTGPVRHADQSAEPTATLADVDVRSALSTRPPRLPDSEGLDRALAVLAREMTENPPSMLQRLVETALDLCRADTAGLSLLEGNVFRWEAVAGVFASYRDGTMPRAASPCGVCIDENVTQLMHLPDRCFPALRAEPRFVEALLIAFQVRGRPVGTVWIVSHTDGRKFDREDERVVADARSVRGGGLAALRIAHDGPAALQALSKFKPDVVLLDVGLPGMDGYQVARRMRDEALESRLTIIAMSGYGRTKDHRSGHGSGLRRAPRQASASERAS